MSPRDDAPPSAPARDCGGCALHTSRRDFLGGLATTLAAFAVHGLLPREAAALPATLVQGVRSNGEVRYPIPASDGVSIDRKEGVIVARHEGMLYAFALTCPHQNTALRWNEGSRSFVCTRHKSKYRPDGLFISGRATRAMDRFAVRKEGDALVVDLDRLFEQDVDAAGWGGAHVAV